MKRHLLALGAVVLLLLSAHGVAQGQALTVSGELEIGENVAPAYWLAVFDDATAEGDPVLGLTWAPIPVGWFGSVWGIQLVSNTDVLPAAHAVRGEGDLAGVSIMNLVHADPRPGHRYEAQLSYDAFSGAAAVRITDVTSDDVVVETGVQLNTFGSSLQLQTTALEPATVQTDAAFYPVGIDWRLLQMAPSGQQMAANPVDRRLPVTVSMRVPWKDVAGGLRLSLFHENGSVFDMGTLPFIGDTLTELSFADVPPGVYDVRADYVSDDGTLVMPVGSTALRVGIVTARLEGAGAELLDGDRVAWHGELVVSADGPVPDVTVAVDAALDKWVLDTSSLLNHWAIATVADNTMTALEHTFAFVDEQEQRLPVQAELPIALDVEWPYRIWDARLLPAVTTEAGTEQHEFTAVIRAYADEPPAPRDVVRVMSYNIQHGEGMDGRLDLQRLADVIALADADVVGLQEVDVGTRRANGVDQLQVLAALLRMEARYGPAIAYQGGQYGNGILSRHPIVRHQNVPLPSLGHERRGQLEATVNIHGTPLSFTVTHLSLDDDENELQRRFILDRLREVDEAFVLLGDFNMVATAEADPRRTLDPFVRDAWLEAVQLSEPGSRLRLTSTAGYTFSAARPSRRIDYVFLSDALTLPGAQAVYTINTQASDHLPLVAEIVWPPSH